VTRRFMESRRVRRSDERDECQRPWEARTWRSASSQSSTSRPGVLPRCWKISYARRATSSRGGVHSPFPERAPRVADLLGRVSTSITLSFTFDGRACSTFARGRPWEGRTAGVDLLLFAIHFTPCRTRQAGGDLAPRPRRRASPYSRKGKITTVRAVGASGASGNARRKPNSPAIGQRPIHRVRRPATASGHAAARGSVRAVSSWQSAL